MSNISPLAYVHPEAVIGENCEIGPFCYIDKNVVIGNDNKIMNSVTILSGTRMGDGNTVFPGAVIGAIPQDLKFRGEETTAEIGNHNLIRENVTINRGTAAKGRTVIGSYNLLMEAAHVAHDVQMGNRGGSRTAQDIPPYIMAAREPIAYCGLNIVGLKRNGFSQEIIDNIHNTYRLLYQRGKLRSECLEEIRQQIPMSPEIEYILNFVEQSARGIIK